MTFGTFQTLVLQHIDQYSVAGETVAPSYNNQSDDLLRIAALFNIANNTIVTQTAPIEASFEAASRATEMPGGWSKIEMPEDFWEMTGHGLPMIERNGDIVRTMEYRYWTDNVILVRTRDVPRLTITYYRKPKPASGKNPDEVLDATERVVECASFYVAAQLVRQEDAFVYQSLYNEFESMMARLKAPMRTELTPVRDAYDLGYAPY